MVRLGCAVTLFLIFAASGQAQPGLAENDLLARVGIPGESPRTARRLEAVDKLLAQKQWAEAIDGIQRLLAEAADDLVHAQPPSPRHLVQARRLCQVRLAALPPEARQLYRARVDNAARKWLDEGVANHDAVLLRRLVDEAFLSRHTEAALDQLGGLAFERGQFEEAERYWRLIAPLHTAPLAAGPESALDLRFPDPRGDVAGIRAKQLLSRWFRGDRETWVEDWETFQRDAGQASGMLAGRQGVYAETLRLLAENSLAIAPPGQSEAWATFAGSASRNGAPLQVRGRLTGFPHLDGPLWTVRLDSGIKIPATAASPGPPTKVDSWTRAARQLRTYPLIVGDRVIIADDHFITAFDLRTGSMQLRYDAVGSGGDGTSPAGTDVDAGYTITADGDYLFARVGSQVIGPRKGTDPESGIACLSLHAPDASVERWVVKASDLGDGPAQFEGAPVATDGRLYCALTHFEGVQTQTAIVCLDAVTHALRWRQEICETQEFRDGEHRSRLHLVTLAGPVLVYASHSGAIVGLDARTGRRLWGWRYPSRGPKWLGTEPSPRGLAPCLAAAGRIYIAPLDYDRILCLDPTTGQRLWESTPLEMVHLLGVARGRLVFTALTPRACLRALNAATGTPLSGWYQPADGTELHAFGRGFLTEDRVYWPTRQGLHVLRLDDAEPLEQDPKIVGNLAAANGCLIAANGQELSAYVPESLLTPTDPAAAALGQPGLPRR